MDDPEEALVRWLMALRGASLPPHATWVTEAACLGMDTRIFFPRKGQPTAPAKKVCAGCPVVDDCLQYALDYEEDEHGLSRHGVFGGQNRFERAQLARRQAAA